MLVRLAALACAGAIAGTFASGASSSELIGRNASDVRLQVNAQGQALVTFRSGGVTQSLLAWGALNARPPTQGTAQVKFQITRSGAGGFRNVCRPYSGPRLDWFVAACTAPDGTHWALQSWQRMLPNYGVPASPDRSAWELRLSHFSGAPAILEIALDWSYGRFHHLYGRLAYQGRPVHGFASTRWGVPLDDYGRNVYVDTFSSLYGRGWKRENSFLAHRPTGAFCYGFYPHAGRPPGAGKKYRATVIGPGVSPDVMWEGRALGPFDPARDGAANAAQRRLLGRDPLCKIN
jgi:hypothetical protein